MVLISCLAVLGHDAFRAWETRSVAIAQVRREAENLAWGGSQQAEGSFRLINAILSGLVERVQVDGIGTTQLERLRANMTNRLANVRLLEDLVLVDQHGVAVVDGQPVTPPIRLGDRSYFTYLQDHEDATPFIGEPVVSRMTGRQIIPVAQRINRPDGSFAGVLVATIDVPFFLDFYRTFNLGRTSTVSLVHRDGRVLIRQPSITREDSAEGIRKRAAFLSTTPSQTTEVTFLSDGVERIISYRAVAGYPLVFAVALGKEEQLANWKTNTTQHLLGTTLLILLLGLFGSRLAAEMRRAAELHRQNALAAAANNEDLSRLSRHLAKARDRAEAASRAKSRFLAGMSHELRTPLNGVLGYASLLRSEGGLTPVQTTRLDAMLQAGKHLLEMITCVLDLSEIEAGHVELRKVVFDARAVAEACLDLVRPGADAKGLTLGVVVQAGTPTTLLTDPTRLRQVLLNLLGNAVKFTGQGGVEVRLRRATDPALLRVEVWDTGPGIPPEQRSHLFQDFVRLDHARTNSIEGAGLGLALSNGIAQLMGGPLHYEDNPAGGSIFSLELPLIARHPRIASALNSIALLLPERTCATDRPQVAPLRILLADDVAMNRDIAGAMLQAAGHHVTFANDGLEAIAAATDGTFDAILLDVRMPNVDGLEAARRIRRLSGPRGQVPIIALTAQAFADQLALCNAAGMNDYLLKPFEPEALLETLARVVASQAGNEAAEPPASTSPVLGFDLVTLDQEVFKRTGSYLPSERVADYMQAIKERADTLLGNLRQTAGSPVIAPEIVAEAHTLAGSAGMFGFVRLAEISRRFESAVKGSTAELPALLAGLAAALEATLNEITPLSGEHGKQLSPAATD